MTRTKCYLQRIAVMLLYLLATATIAVAQGVTIHGTVVDSQGESIIGASVVLKNNAAVGVVTDIDGNFKMKVPSENAPIVVSYVGMQTVTLNAKSGKPMKIVLEDDNQSLDELVVVGYGQQKKASVVGAITQTTGKVLERAAGITDLGSAITGNLPGVVTSASSGMPGEEEPEIVIRGSSSWNGSSPLVLVDGVERPMSSVDIHSVESISVLKDASATAVYGVKGANGVILITTKRGSEGKPVINVSGNAIMKIPSKLPGKYDSYDALMARNMAAEHELNINPASWSDINTMDFISNYRNQTTVEQQERYPNVDWQKALFKDYCMSYNAAINVAGGTKNVKYYAAIDFVNEGDLFKTYDTGRGYDSSYGYNRINVRSNLDFNLTKTTVLKVNLAGAYGVQKSPYLTAYNANAGDTWQVAQQWAGAYNIAPDVFLPKYSDGSWGFYPLVSNVTNSAENMNLGGTNKKTTARIFTDFVLDQDLSFITKGLNFHGLVSWDNTFLENFRGVNDLNNSASRKWINPETGKEQYAVPFESKNQFDFTQSKLWTIDPGTVDNNATVRNLYYQFQFNWARKYGKHDISAMGLFSRSENATGSMIPYYREDWAFRLTYNYADRYFAEYNGAYNGSERFSADNRFAFFQSGALGWMITNEPWMKSLTDAKLWGAHILDMLKMRISYGEIGDDSYSTRWLYANQWAYGGQTFLSITPNTPSPYTWYREASVGNPDAHWEVVRKLNFGVDYSFFDGLLAGNVEFFQDKRSDILIGGSSRSVPSYYGQTAPTVNLGKVTTKGFEIELRVNKVFRGGHRVWGNFNMTYAKNHIDVKDDQPLRPSYQKAAGYSINQTVSHINGTFANTQDELYGTVKHDSNDGQKLVGDYNIVDFNGDGIIDNYDSAPYAYTSNPQNTYNATIGYEWKGLSFFVQFYGVTNVTRLVDLTSFNSRLNTVFDQGSWWSQSKDAADVVTPRLNSTPTYYYGTQMLYDGSFIRLKNIELGYTFTDKWVKSIGLTSLKVYVSGNNLWMKTNMPDDRETNGSFGGAMGAYPTVKRVNFGIKFSL